MRIIIGFCIFCLVLFMYLHVQFHLKTGEDLEMYEVDQPSKDKLEEICDLRQPVLFDFDCQVGSSRPVSRLPTAAPSPRKACRS